MDQKLLDEINEKIRDMLAQSPAADIEKNLRVMLAGLFGRLDLVRRDEFDVQREVLVRTRAKLAELEQKVAALEAAATQSPDAR
jgi:ubiquinone biosynthesis accessory factor UbiK